jgi:hypothetical protein
VVEVVPDFVKPGHRFDTGPFLLDLYRLFGIVYGDRQLTRMEEEQHSIASLRGAYLYSELIRILTSTAVVLRILFDQHPELFAEVSQRPCGKLQSDRSQTQIEDLMLREACNKIIHATKVHYDEQDPDPGYSPDQIGMYILAYVHLYGERNGLEWKADLSIINFAKFAVSVLARFHH